ncbi:MAG: hypothetical protein KDD94_02525, partial [Calditrichaeota bacterium]|nr:hypothetical protein [Calditrichota bacterium]
PPLRERRHDIQLLLDHFKKDKEISYSDRLLNWLEDQEWPGNIREFKSAVERAELNASLKQRQVLLPADFDDQGNVGEAPDLADNILLCLQRYGFKHRSISDTAKDLNIHRSTVLEYYRGWILHYYVTYGRETAIEYLIGKGVYDNLQLFNEKFDNVIQGFKERLNETDSVDNFAEIKLKFFKKLPVFFDPDLKQLLSKMDLLPTEIENES